MDGIKFELTEEQKEALQKVGEVFNRIADAAKELWAKIKKAMDVIASLFREYVMNMEPKKRYKLLKRLSITNYIPYFRREGIFRCRNNC